MLLGIPIRPWMVVAGGATLLVLVWFQILVGKRIIKFKGPLHMKVHRAVAWTLGGLALVHATVAIFFLFG